MSRAKRKRTSAMQRKIRRRWLKCVHGPVTYDVVEFRQALTLLDVASLEIGNFGEVLGAQPDATVNEPFVLVGYGIVGGEP